MRWRARAGCVECCLKQGTRSTMRIDAIAIGHNPPDDVNVIVEVPVGGEPIKYEMDKAAGTLVVDRFLYTSMRYPGNYGFIPHTLSGDGDPVDVLIANQRGIIPGAVVACRPVGVLKLQHADALVCAAFSGEEIDLAAADERIDIKIPVGLADIVAPFPVPVIAANQEFAAAIDDGEAFTPCRAGAPAINSSDDQRSPAI